MFAEQLNRLAHRFCSLVDTTELIEVVTNR